MKKIIVLILNVMAFSVLAAPEDFEIFYSYNPDGSISDVSIMKYRGNEKEVIIPYEIFEGAFVKQIGNSSFRNNQTIESVVIPEGVLWIEQGAFQGCTNLKKVILPKTLERIEGYAFDRCESLSKINLENNLTILGEGTFMSCLQLNEVVVPESLQFLGRNAFFDCPRMQDIYFKGNAPYVPTLDFPVTDPVWSWCAEYSVFGSIQVVTHVHYLVGTTGWNETPQTWVRDPWAYLETWTLPADEPEVFISQKTRKDDKVGMTLVFGGVLQSSSDLKNWETVATQSPYQVSEPVTAGRKFYRAKAQE